MPAVLSAYAAGVIAADAGWPPLVGAIGPAPILALGSGLLVLALAPVCPLPIKAIAVWTAVALAGALRLQAEFAIASQHPIWRPEVVRLEGRIEALRADRVWLRGVRRVGPGAPIPARVLLKEPHPEEGVLDTLQVGQSLRTRARLSPWPQRRNPGGHDLRRRQRRRGLGAEGWRVESAPLIKIQGVASVGRGAEIGSAWHSLENALRGWRLRSVARLKSAGDGGSLLAALSFGERRGMAGYNDAFRALGLSHLLAVSGLHLALVGVAAFRGAFLALQRLPPSLVARIGDSRRFALAAGLVGTACYAWISGGAVPVTRAWWVGAGFACAWWLRRPVRPAAPLHFAAGALLVADPAALFDPGAQLSFAACYALVIRTPCVPNFFSALGRGLGHSADIIAATTPIAAATLGAVSPWGLAANLVAVPWTALVLLPVSLAAAVATTLPVSIGDWVIAGCAALGAWSLDAVSRFAGALPLAPPVATAPTGIAVGLGVALWVLRTARLWKKLLGALGIPLLLIVWPPSVEEPASPRAVFFDVGQGEASLVQGRMASVLIDGGRAAPGRAGHGRRTLLPALRALRVRHLDLVVATHRDLDHRGGLEHVLTAFSVGTLWIPWGGQRDAAFGPLIEIARMRGVAVLESGHGAAPFASGTLRIVPLWPPQRWRGTSNDRSLVVVAELRNAPGDRPQRVLFTGDIGRRAEAALLDSGVSLRAGVIKLAHHGSRTSSTREFLDAVGAEVAIASSARFHRFGMPHAVVCQRVRRAGAPLWHTGSDGAVWVALGARLWVRGSLSARSTRACGRQGPPP